MLLLLILSIGAFGLCVVLTPLVRDIFLRLGLVDVPDSDRKVHTRPIPRVGGISIAAAYVATFGAIMVVPLHLGLTIEKDLLLVWRILPAAGIVFLVGLIDDIRGLRPWQKLAGELVAAGLAYWSGVRVLSIAGHPIGDALGIAISLVWFVGCANAFNLIDGMDGLASGVGLFATLTIFTAALLDENYQLALVTAPLAGCLLGFLCFNFNPASIFLGDSGSLLIGFLLGCYGVIWSQKAATALAMTAPLMALSIPLLDTGLSIVRRFLRHQPIFGADRDHIHHRLLKRGLTPRHVTLVLYGLCSIAAGFSLLQSVSQVRYSGAIIVLFCLAAWIGVQHLGYVEFSVARDMVLGGGFRRILNAQIHLLACEQHLESAKSVDECWAALCEASKNFGFNQVRLEAGSTTYSRRLGSAPPEACWTLQIRLSPTDSVEFSREFHSLVQPTLTAHFVDMVHSRLKAKLRELEHNLFEVPTGRDLNAMTSSAGD